MSDDTPPPGSNLVPLTLIGPPYLHKLPSYLEAPIHPYKPSTHHHNPLLSSKPSTQLTAPYSAHSPLLSSQPPTHTFYSPLRVLLVAWVKKVEKERKVPR